MFRNFLLVLLLTVTLIVISNNPHAAGIAPQATPTNRPTPSPVPVYTEFVYLPIILR